MSRKNRNYQVDEVMQSLNKKPGVFVHINVAGGGVIEIDRQKLEIGNKSKGKIDFLVNYKNFVISYK